MTEINANETTMVEVVSVKFRYGISAYYFDPQGVQFSKDDCVITETSRGCAMGTVTCANHMVDVNALVKPLRPILRKALPEDLAADECCRSKEKDAFAICRRKIEAHGLEMKLINVEYAFDGSRILFYFSSDGRVDFRELVKDLASVFHTRIELRQIGVRDEARMLGGLGICGRPFCCTFSMQEFQPVSTKMAKTQSMSLNPGKISGACGRLMCCLRYEQPAYEELVKNVPKNGAFVETPDGYGNITQVNVLRQTVKVRLDAKNGGDMEIRQYDADEVAAVPGGRPRDGAEPPHVLQLRPKAEKPEEDESGDSDWHLPEMLISSPEELRRRSEQYEKFERPQPAQEQPQERRSNRRQNPSKQQSANAGERRDKTRYPQQHRQPRPKKPAAPEGEAPAAQNTKPAQDPQQRSQHRKPPQKKQYNKPAAEGTHPEQQPRQADGNKPEGEKKYRPNHRRYRLPRQKNNGEGGAPPKKEE